MTTGGQARPDSASPTRTAATVVDRAPGRVEPSLAVLIRRARNEHGVTLNARPGTAVWVIAPGQGLIRRADGGTSTRNLPITSRGRYQLRHVGRSPDPTCPAPIRASDIPPPPVGGQ